jgi:RNAse (barnase) inhibitor barstar
MQPVTAETVTSSARPWLHVTDDFDLHAAVDLVERRGGRVIRFNGTDLASVDKIFDNYSSAFRFPDYFGRNWNAFDECITTLAEIPSAVFLTVITEAEELLVADPADLPVLLRLLDEAGRSWSRKLGLGSEWGGGDVAFNTVLVCSSSKGVERLRNARN